MRPSVCLCVRVRVRARGRTCVRSAMVVEFYSPPTRRVSTRVFAVAATVQLNRSINNPRRASISPVYGTNSALNYSIIEEPVSTQYNVLRRNSEPVHRAENFLPDHSTRTTRKKHRILWFSLIDRPSGHAEPYRKTH